MYETCIAVLVLVLHIIASAGIGAIIGYEIKKLPLNIKKQFSETLWKY